MNKDWRTLAHELSQRTQAGESEIKLWMKEWPAEYFGVFSSGEVAVHFREMAALGPERPVILRVRALDSDLLGVTVLAYDRLGVFGIIAGLLGSLGANIERGQSFTSLPLPADKPSRGRRLLRRGWQNGAPAGKRKIIDYFLVRIQNKRDEKEWTAEALDIFETVFGILGGGDDNDIRRARRMVNEHVAGSIGQAGNPGQRALYPVKIDVDNSGVNTALIIESQDTPFFLYSLAAALSLRKITIESVGIDTLGGVVRDRINVLNSHGEKIVEEERVDEIRFSVLLTKQFTFFLNVAPDPYVALERFQRITETIFSRPGRGAWLKKLDNPRTLSDLARLLGASDYLWEDFIRAQHENLLPLMNLSHSDPMMDFSTPALRKRMDEALDGIEDPEAFRRALNRWKDHELFLVDLRQILHPSDKVRELAEPMTRLAELVVESACTFAYRITRERYGVPRTVGGLEAAWAVFGLGKFGGVALGYASDIELLFVYSDAGVTDGDGGIDNGEFFERFVEGAIGMIRARREGVFEIDMRLRPFGKDGPLAASLESFCRYYGPGGAALGYELMALTRLRRVAGGDELGRRIERLRDEFVYRSRTPRIGDVRELREKQYALRGSSRRPNAKFSSGALVDIEYCVQMLQVLHARNHPRMRTPRIHEALAALKDAGIIADHDCKRLTDAYYFLRRLINGLRMLRGNARDLVLPSPDTLEYQHLARRMGYRRRGGLDAGRQLHMEFSTQTAVVRDFMSRHFGRDYVPDVNQGNVADLLLSEAPSDSLRDFVLGGMGFGMPERAFHNLRKLAGSGKRMDIFIRLAILAGDMLRSSSDADMALNNWERIVVALPNAEFHFAQLLLQPRRLEILLTVCAASQFMADTLARNPDFFDWATDPVALKTVQDRDRMLANLDRFCASARNETEWLDAMRRFRRREILRIGTLDLCVRTSLTRVTAELSALAEAVIERWTRRAYDILSAGRPESVSFEDFAVLALGKLGGGELNYSSDVDLIGVCAEGGDGTRGSDARTRFLANWMSLIREGLSKYTRDGYAYRVDLRLRPHGTAGPIVVGEKALIAYFRGTAAPWERQALLKIRPVAGGADLGIRVAGTLRRLLREPTDMRKAVEEIRFLRGKAADKNKAGTIDVKSGPGGIRDIEFLVQALQLRYLPEHAELDTGHTVNALEKLRACDLLDEKTVASLLDAYRFLRRVEHLLQILEDRQTHSLPEEGSALRSLSRRLPIGQSDEQGLLEYMNKVRETTHAIYNEILEKLEKGF